MAPTTAEHEHWATSWTASMQGPYPVGNAAAQPDLACAFPVPEAGARNQTFRLIVRPELWGRQARLRFSNVLGTCAVTFDDVYVGLQLGSAAVLAGTQRAVTFAHKSRFTVPAGTSRWSDPVALDFVRDPDAPELLNRRLAVSFHVAGESGPMSWHAKAMTTSYVTGPDSGSQSRAEDEAAFPYTTTSWYFVDALDMMMPAATRVIVCFGDSITDGTATTLNGDDRWCDVLSRRLHARHGNRVAVLNAGIGGNQVLRPAEYSPQNPFSGGPAARERVERDVLTLSGVSTVIWLEGINDFSRNGNASTDAVQACMKEVVALMRARLPGVRVVGGTVTTALGSTRDAHGFPEQDDKRRSLNTFILQSGCFDAVIDFDRVILDPRSGTMRAEFVPDSTCGEAGDGLHPNRAGHLSMGTALDLDLFL
jgi:lysophospholipase L1-like esterase